jgi:hypothetical protein
MFENILININCLSNLCYVRGRGYKHFTRNNFEGSAEWDVEYILCLK